MERSEDHFLDDPELTPLADGVRWKLDNALKYYMDDENGRSEIDVPEGFITDFASVPRVFWNVFPPWGKYGNAAILHDFLYSTQLYTRDKSDRILLDAMEALGVNWGTRWTIYLAVRAGGWVAWNEHKRQNESQRI